MSTTVKSEIDRLREWIAEHNPDAGPVGDDDDLIDTRILDSFKFMRFIYFIEEVFEREVKLDESVAKNFRTLAAICSHFKKDGQPALEESHA
jgi:acyl carrier protein